MMLMSRFLNQTQDPAFSTAAVQLPEENLEMYALNKKGVIQYILDLHQSVKAPRECLLCFAELN